MKLINKIKPGILISLNVAGREYPHSHKLIMTILKKKSDYRDLTIEEIRTTCTFLPDRYQPKNMIDLKYGDWLVVNKFNVKPILTWIIYIYITWCLF